MRLVKHDVLGFANESDHFSHFFKTLSPRILKVDMTGKEVEWFSKPMDSEKPRGKSSTADDQISR